MKDPTSRTLNTNVFPKCKVMLFFVERGIQGLWLKIYPENTRFSWKTSKMLRYGSMIIFSHDNFETLYTAVIRESNEQMMDTTLRRYGYSQISIQLLDKRLSPIQVYERMRSSNVVILESKAYFQAYYYVLKILQELTEIPLSNIIVDLDFPYHRPPAYLTSYYRQQAEYAVQQITTFDRAQKAAVLSCFDRSLTIIQGPPGTGKTYIGAKIFKILLDIIKLRERNGNSRYRNPIYLVCYTNHALDQFLQKIEEYTTQIIRLGGQSKIDRFKKYLLKEKKIKNSKEYPKFKRQEEIYAKKYKKISYVLQHFIHLKIIHPQLHSLLYRKIELEFHHCCTVKEQQINRQAGQNAVTIFNRALSKIRQLMKYPQIFHWLGLFCLDHLQQNARSYSQMRLNSREERKQRHRNDYYDENDNYVQDLHSQETRNYREELQQIQEMQPPFQSLYDTLKKEIQKRISNYITDYQQNDGQIPSQPYQLSMRQRWSLNLSLVQKEEALQKQQITRVVQKLKEIQIQLDEIDMDQSVRALEAARVVAMTTTGAAKYKDILKQVKSKIMIVEQAAEVLEAHIITALTPSTQQLILIGDHEQLRPSTSVYDLAKNYNLDVSLFERLVMSKGDARLEYPCVTLIQQRRMRPQISHIMKQIYPGLQDADSVRGRPHIRGMGGKSVFFMDHCYKEVDDERIQSKKNPQEGKLILHFARYLIQQGYKGTQITILALYKAQLFYIRENLSDFKEPEAMNDIAVVTVDNYQGEQNDIILLSLVRNNKENNIGFLKVSNRVCVALSRARYGLYIFGSRKCLKNGSAKSTSEQQRQEQLWVRVIKRLKQENAIGKYLTLKCQYHGKENRIKKVEDFQKVPDGRCQERCNFPIGCGHNCIYRCHQINKTQNDPYGHHWVNCSQPCVRDHGCGHSCQYLCYQCKTETMPCQQMKWVRLRCGHMTEVNCYRSQDFQFLDQIQCNYICQRNHDCRHRCQYRCHQCKIRQQPCQQNKEVLLPCNHQVIIRCYQSRNRIYLNSIQCQQSCIRAHNCRHSCTYKCFECKYYQQDCNVQVQTTLSCGHRSLVSCYRVTKNLNIQCKDKCEKFLKCGHKCQGICGRDCSLVTQILINQGFLSSCRQKVLKRMPCLHYSQIECGQLPQRYFELHNCSAQCNKELECKHKCSRLCKQCNRSQFHGMCQKKCEKTLLCSHICQAQCGDCPPCKQQCAIACVHRYCPKLCGEKCEKCEQPCPYSCIHSQCTKKCFQICNRAPCNFRCNLKLKCGHSCLGLCGQKCPDLCRICDPQNENLRTLSDQAARLNSKFVQILSCGHCFVVEELDQFMAFEQSENVKICFKKCPRCDKLITNCPRYQEKIKHVSSVMNKIKENTSSYKRQIQSEVVNLISMQQILSIYCRAKTQTCNLFQELISRLSGVNRVESFQKLRTAFNSLEVIKKIILLENEYHAIIGEIKRPIQDIIQQLYFTNIPQKRMRLFFRIIKVATLYLALATQKVTGEFSDSNFILSRVKFNSLVINQSLLRALERAYESQFQSRYVDPKLIKNISLYNGAWFECRAGHLFNKDDNEEINCPVCLEGLDITN